MSIKYHKQPPVAANHRRLFAFISIVKIKIFVQLIDFCEKVVYNRNNRIG